MNQHLCVIPMRSGSKGLPHKNVRLLAGKPVVAYTIEACLESDLFDEVYVATDDAEYARLAEEWGAKVPFLEPEPMASDEVPSSVPVVHYARQMGFPMDQEHFLWCMQPTSPLRSPSDIVAASSIIEQDEGCDFVDGITLIDPHYFHWALLRAPDGVITPYFGQEFQVDRTELPFDVWRPNGAIKVGRASAVARAGSFFGGRIRGLEMPEERSIHIRSQFDFDVCEYLLTKESSCEA